MISFEITSSDYGGAYWCGACSAIGSTRIRCLRVGSTRDLIERAFDLGGIDVGFLVNSGDVG
jgi:hypothetical protein